MEAKRMRTVILCGALTAFAGAALAQQQPTQQPPLSPQSTTGMSNNQVGAQRVQQQMQNLDLNHDTGSTGLSGPDMRDRNFLRTAYSGGLAEIQMAKMALSKSSNADVKAFAQMMLDDHATLNADLQKLAQEHGVTLTERIGKDDQTEAAKLKDMAGDSFDKEYAVYMVTSHRTAQHDFRVEASAADASGDLKEHVAKGLVTIHSHTQAAQKMAADMGVTVPAPTRTPPPAAH